jgi:hypothetical protein
MSRLPVSRNLRRLVAARADYRCEYCRLSEADTSTRHTIDHIIAVKHGGPTEPDNLALACVECNPTRAATSPPSIQKALSLCDCSIRDLTIGMNILSSTT